MREWRVRVEGLTWRDTFGVVHAVGDNHEPTLYGSRSIAYALASPCGVAHHMTHSNSIRAENRRDVVTCLECVAAPAWAWIDYDVHDLLTIAPCCVR